LNKCQFLQESTRNPPGLSGIPGEFWVSQY
jgi:hypothetical protein